MLHTAWVCCKLTSSAFVFEHMHARTPFSAKGREKGAGSRGQRVVIFFFFFFFSSLFKGLVHFFLHDCP